MIIMNNLINNNNNFINNNLIGTYLWPTGK